MVIADTLQEIYNNVDKVHEAGKEAQYNDFWDAYQENGNRTNYNKVFAGRGWTKETFKPKYTIAPNTANQMFSEYSLLNVDLVEYLNELGIGQIDFSNCTTFSETFIYTGVKRVGVIDTRKSSSLTHIFHYGQTFLKTVDLLILKEDGSQNFLKSSFDYCSGLTNITIQGVIGAGGINLKWSTNLSKDSITSFINALSNTTSGLTITFSKTAKEAAFTTEEWEDLIYTKQNWTINLE